MISTFQAIVYAIVHSLCEILPIGGKAGTLLMPEIFGWVAPPPELRAAIGLGICIAIFFFFSVAMKSFTLLELKSMSAVFSAGKMKRSKVRVSVCGVAKKFSITWLMC